MKEVSSYNPSKDPRLINCKAECGDERCFAKRYGLFAERTCPNFTEPKLQTNADRIRAMADEELAEFLEMIPYCGNPPTYTTDGFCIDDGLRTKRQWFDWLKEEAKE